MEIRSFGMPVKAIEALGGIPVAMAQADAYEALARGLVQGNCAPLEVLKGFRQAEVTSYITYAPFISNAVFFLTMNLDMWNSFPADIQEAITKVNDKIFEDVASNLWDIICDEGLDFAKDEFGHEEIWLTDDEFNKWIDKLTPILDEYAEGMEERGLPGREIVETLLQLADKYNALYG
jgi:TRAP-type C4-dicarboxylate transport system substrate-binding protein